MKGLLSSVLLSVSVSTAWATAPDFDRFTVRLTLENRAGVPNTAVQGAQKMVAAIYAKHGIPVCWNRSSSAQPGDPCSPDKPIWRLRLVLEPIAPSSVSAEVLGSARPFDPDSPIRIYFDRVQPIIEQFPLDSGVILGHILAHEIGHVLQGVLRHSSAGLMKPKFNRMDIVNMRAHPLPLAAEDISFMQWNWERRHLGSTRPLSDSPAAPAASGN